MNYENLIPDFISKFVSSIRKFSGVNQFKQYDNGMPTTLQIGDIILLHGRAATTKPNKLGQTVLRLRTAKHSHVAIAYSSLMIADATPDHGVNIRLWRDVAEFYDLSKSHIFRLVNPINEDRLKSKINFYLMQPYNIFSILRKDSLAQDGAGMVCSQFASLIFSDLSVPLSPRESSKCLPIDIYDYLRYSKKFKLLSPIIEPKLGQELNPPEKYQQFVEELEIEVIKSELAASRLQYSLNDASAAITEILKANADKFTIDQISSLIDKLESSQVDEFGDEDYLRLWEAVFIDKTYKVEPTFLHELKDAHSHIVGSLMSISKQDESIASEEVPKLLETLFSCIESTHSLFEVASRVLLADADMAKIKLQSEAAFIGIQLLIDSLDRVLPPISEEAFDHLETLRLKIAGIQPLEQRRIAVDCFEGKYLLAIRQRYWSANRKRIEFWIASLKDLAKIVLPVESGQQTVTQENLVIINDHAKHDV